MSQSLLLSAEFVAHLAEPSSHRQLSPFVMQALDAHLQRLCEQAAAAQSEARVPALVFTGYLARRVPADAKNLETWLTGLPVGDLYLACACLRGCPGGVAALEKILRVHIRPLLLARFTLLPQDLDEIMQQLRERLLIPGADGPAKIDKYAGQSALLTWLRPVAARVALNYLKRDKERRGPALDAEDEGEAAVVLSLSFQPELQLIKDHLRDPVQRALQDAFRSLSRDQRRLLRQHIIEGLSKLELARRYHVHDSNIGRWLRKALESVHAEAQRILAAELGTDKAEAEEIIQFVRDQLHISIDRVLRSSSSQPGVQDPAQR